MPPLVFSWASKAVVPRLSDRSNNETREPTRFSRQRMNDIATEIRPVRRMDHQPLYPAPAPQKRAFARGWFSSVAAWVIQAALLLFSASAFAASEQTFRSLQVGSHTYENVRVTTKSKNYIFIVYSGGMANIKVSELSHDLLMQLGYIAPAKPHTNTAAAWARKTVAKVDTAPIVKLQANLLQKWHATGSFLKTRAPSLKPGIIILGGTLLLLAYAFLCFCCALLCQKTGIKPGVLVWLPFLQVVPLLRAASMSPWWVAAMFVPLLNLVAYVLWCARIVRARNKTLPLLILLLFPPTTLFAFAYLAFSEASGEKQEKLRVEMMTLESA